MDTIKIIIADDQLLFRKGLIALINGFERMSILKDVSNGQELLEQLELTPDLPDVILMDLNMPVINGIEATERIRQKYPAIKIIALSVYDDEKFIFRIIEKGASSYLLKNAEPEEVEKTIREVLRSGYYFNEKIVSALVKGASKKNKILSFTHKNITLSEREIDVLKLICKELTAAEIAQELFISIRTVDGHRQNLLDKTGARNTAGLVLFAVRNDLVDLPFNNN